MVKSISRAIDVLEALAFADEDIALTQLQEQVDLSAGTLHRLLQALMVRGYVEQDIQTRRYGPGLKMLEVGEAARRNSRFRLGHVVRPFLRQLTEVGGETSNFVIRHNDSIVYIEQVVGPRSVRMFTEVGHRAPLYCTGAGKAILSCLPDEKIEAYLATAELEPKTPNTRVTVEALTSEICQIRQRGFAIDDEEFEHGVRCVAAPIVDVSGRCVGALSVSGPSTHMTKSRVEDLGPQVQRVGAQCSADLGHSPATVR